VSDKQSKIDFWSYFQSLGKTFMTPVSLLAAMGLLLGVGSAFTSSDMLEKFPLLATVPARYLFGYLTQLGSLAFSNLSVMFAIAIPMGLAKKEKGVAAFAGFVGFVAMHLGSNFALGFAGILQTPGNTVMMRSAGQAVIMGIHTIDSGVLGGIFVGALVASLHERFYTIKLPDAFAFFGGPRFVPIISASVASLIGLFVPTIWPIFSNAILFLGSLIQKSGVAAPFVFFSSERFLIPLGLHHILVALVRFTEVGGTEVVDGQVVSGALNIFYSQIRAGEAISAEATRFLSQGKMPSFLFGLPAAAIAMYHLSFKENRPIVRSLFLSGIIACTVGGITEPIEFLFLFVSPMLFLFHSLMTGLGAMLVAIMGVKIGNTDGNIIDLVIYGMLQGSESKWYLIFLIGPFWALAYYGVFYYTIKRFNLKTPGRDIVLPQESASESASPDKTTSSTTDFTVAERYLKALGGKENIESIDNCITRLRLEMKDMNLVDVDTLKGLGAAGVVKKGEHALQVVIGPQVHVLRQQLDKLL
jgi:maltose/glucose PTS system EIICB component